jgi:hypothetical protein
MGVVADQLAESLAPTAYGNSLAVTVNSGSREAHETAPTDL